MKRVAWFLAVVLMLELAVPMSLALAESLPEAKIGPITQDETWRGKILLLGDVEIAPGTTVTVEPGTKIVINGEELGQSGELPTAPEIVVKGNLRLEALPASPIEFAPLRNAPPEPLSLENTSTQIIQFQPYAVDLQPLRKDFDRFQMQYFVFWTVLWGVQWLFR